MSNHLYLFIIINYIYPNYQQNCKETIQKKGFYNTPTLLERATHPQEKNPCSLFSSPLPLLYLERRFVPKHNSHLFRM